MGNGALLNLKGFPTLYAARPTAASASVYPKRTRSSSFKACEQIKHDVKLIAYTGYENKKIKLTSGDSACTLQLVYMAPRSEET